jgi:hypothetical protein
MGNFGMEDSPRGARGFRLWWVIVLGLGVIAAGMLLVVWQLERNSTRQVLDEMSRRGAQGFSGGLIWSRYEPFTAALTNKALLAPPKDFVEQGEKALPDLLKLLDRDVTGAGGAPNWMDRLPPIIRRWLPDNSNQRDVGRAIAAFYVLGSNAAPVLPELSHRLTNYSTSTAAAHALAGIGPMALPAFASALASSNDWVRFCGAWGLGQLGTASRPYAGRVAQAYGVSATSGGSGLMLWSLEKLGGPPEATVPTIVWALGNTNSVEYVNSARVALSALRRLDEIERLPAAHPDAWTQAQRAWFNAQRPALVRQLESLPEDSAASGRSPSLEIKQTAQALKNFGTNPL